LSNSFQRAQANTLTARLREPRRFIQVVAGPRQVGKTTLAGQAAEASGLPTHYASADEPALRGREWLAQQWDAARLLARQGDALLVLDEVQKIGGWSETVKRLWDADSAAHTPVRVVILGSAPLLIGRGLTESLAGRFETVHLPHWSFGEMREAFGWDLDRWLFFGGYPGSAPLVEDEERWARYVKDSLIETTISRDVLLLTRVDKPALLRGLFELGCAYSGQVLSFNKMLGQLHDAGNTTTLAHYLQLLTGAGMVTGLQKFAGGDVSRRASSPKLQVFNTALMSAQSGRRLADARADHTWWGRLVESAIGAQLVNAAAAGDCQAFYWRERNDEVDFIVRLGGQITAIEVKSGRRPDSLPGMDAFAAKFRPHRKLLVGQGGIPLEDFLSRPTGYWFAP
jgi:predicted AAA+ superfamily ATPase